MNDKTGWISDTTGFIEVVGGFVGDGFGCGTAVGEG